MVRERMAMSERQYVSEIRMQFRTSNERIMTTIEVDKKKTEDNNEKG